MAQQEPKNFYGRTVPIVVANFMDAGFHYLDVSLSVVGSGVPEPINQSIKAFVTRTVVKHRLESEARTFARWQGILRLRLSEEVVSR